MPTESAWKDAMSLWPPNYRVAQKVSQYHESSLNRIKTRH